MTKDECFGLIGMTDVYLQSIDLILRYRDAHDLLICRRSKQVTFLGSVACTYNIDWVGARHALGVMRKNICSLVDALDRTSLDVELLVAETMSSERGQ
jgi:hypothetical protein